MTELEALEKIKESLGCDSAYYGLNLEFEILQRALKRLNTTEPINYKYYKLCIRQYNIFVNEYVTYVRYLETNDLYHYIGFLYCNSLEHIKRVDYMEISKEEYDKAENKVWYNGKQYFYSNMKVVEPNV